jgi:hypothetical protein
MGNRLTQIYTRTGDDGTTGLGDGSRVSKDHLRVETMGDVDELNSLIGVLLCEALPAESSALLTDIQHDLFDVGAEICIPGHRVVAESRATELEKEIDAMQDNQRRQLDLENVVSRQKWKALMAKDLLSAMRASISDQSKSENNAVMDTESISAIVSRKIVKSFYS